MQRALANNEILEEAIRRESASSSKNVSWHRCSDLPESRQGLNMKELSDITRPSSRQGSISVMSAPNNEITSAASESASPEIKPISSPPPPQSVPATSQDSRFFRSRFGSSVATSPNPRPQLTRKLLRLSRLNLTQIPRLYSISVRN